jgi:hypothetical protein
MAKNDSGMGVLKMIWKGMPGMPCLMSRGGMADPLDKWAKILSELRAEYKNKKNEYYHTKESEYQWFGSLYLNEENKIVWPKENIKACIKAAAMRFRKGNDIKSLLFVERDAIIECPGIGRKLPDLYADHRFVDRRMVKQGSGKQAVRVPRVRPRFYDWKITVEISYVPNESLTEKQIIDYSVHGGKFIGLSDFRPENGKFTVEAG